MTREGLRRLKPLRAMAAELVPDPGGATARICALESTQYMRNQLLRDADWAGMAHSLEIRVPMVDWRLTEALAPSIATLAAGAGKAALGLAPSAHCPRWCAPARRPAFPCRPAIGSPRAPRRAV